jgi:hypothetical protein
MSTPRTGKTVLFTVAGLGVALVALVFVLIKTLGWINAEGPRPGDNGGPARTPRSTLDVLTDMAADLEKTPAADRPQRRYLTLVHLYNNPVVTEATLESYRRTLRELAGFFSEPGEHLVFRPVDRQQTIFAVNLRDLGWEPDAAWHAILKHNPYGLTYDKVEEAKVREAAAKLRKLSGTPVAGVRGDWLAVALTRAPVGGGDGAIKTGNWPLPPAVRDLATGYDNQELTLQSAAAELGLSEPARLQTLVKEDARFGAKMSLDALGRERGVVQRKAWETLRSGASPYQQLSRQLDLGTPFLAD